MLLVGSNLQPHIVVLPAAKELTIHFKFLGILKLTILVKHKMCLDLYPCTLGDLSTDRAYIKGDTSRFFIFPAEARYYLQTISATAIRL